MMLRLIPLWYQDAVTRPKFAYHQLYHPTQPKKKHLFSMLAKKKRVRKKNKLPAQVLKLDSSIYSINEN